MPTPATSYSSSSGLQAEDPTWTVYFGHTHKACSEPALSFEAQRFLTDTLGL